MKNKKKNKTSNYFILMMVCLSISFISLIMFFIFKDLYILFTVISLLFLLLTGVILIYERRIRKTNYKIEEEDKNNIAKSINEYSLNKHILVNIQSEDKGLRKIANGVNKILVNNIALEYSTLYEEKDFLTLLRKHINLSGLDKFVYIRIFDIKEEMVELIVNKYPRSFINKQEGYFDLVIEIFDKNELEDYLKEFLLDNKSASLVLAYYDEYSLDEINDLINDQNKINDYKIAKYTVYDKNSDKEIFNNVINKYKNIDLAKDNLIEDYLIDIFPYLPVTHMAILIDEDYLRVVNYSGSLQFYRIEENEFKTIIKLNGIKYRDRQIYVIFANENEEVPLTPNLLYQFNKVINIINAIAVKEIDKLFLEESEDRFNRLEEIHDALSYEVNDDFIVKHASKKLNERYDNRLVGSYCYETLYDREEPCKDCPLKNKNYEKTYMLTSSLYKRYVEFNNRRNTIYLLSERKPFINDRSELDNRLLGLLNNPSAKGYLLCFKLDSLPQLAAKYKLSDRKIVDKIIEMLNVYGLSNNLYRKEIDEFVYLLEYGSVADAIRLSKAVSLAFLETFKVEDNEFTFVPKVILLSYPLEVNTIFSMDSLSRTLYNNVTKKGVLYRIDEDPLPIDDHRYYMQIVENSYKEGLIPFIYNKVKDNQNKEQLFIATLNYMDENHNPIKEEQITLYTKIDKTYHTLVDKAIRGLDYESGNNFILTIGKEGLDKKLFETLYGFFSSRKIDPSRVIFEGKEKDMQKHMEDILLAKEKGFRFAITVNDNNFHNLDLNEFAYIRIDGNKLNSDKIYQRKIKDILEHKVDVLIEDKYKHLINGVRYTY